jgi:hypothetical protein
MTRITPSEVLGSAFGRDGLERAIHLPGQLRDPETLRALLGSAVRVGISDEFDRLKLRAFRGSTLDYRLHESLLAQPLDPTADISEWVGRVGGSTSCLAANGLAEWDLDLAIWLIDRIAELQHTCALSLTSRQDTYAFVSGGTGWTSFGIHEDLEPSLIFHLGPSPKRVWVWEPPHHPVGVHYGIAAFGGISFEIDESLPSAREIVLRPGDVLNVPSHMYHVFHNDGPSAFLGLAIRLPDPVHDADEPLLTLARRIAGSAPDHPDGGTDGMTVRPDGAEAFIEELNVLSRARLTKLSSAGFVHAPARRLLDALPEEPGPYRLAFGTVVQSYGASLFVRGRVLRSNLSSTMVERLCLALRTLDPIEATALAEWLGIRVGAATRILSSVRRLGGLVEA